MSYDLELKKRWDDYSALETATREGLNIGREEGREEGVELKSREIVTSLLMSNNFDNKEIANLVKVSEAFVREIREALENKKKV